MRVATSLACRFALVLVASLGFAHVAEAKRAPPPTFFPGYPIAGTPMQERPGALKVGSGTTWGDLTWRSWGDAEAIADGRLRDHPGQAGGIDAPGTVALSAPIRCGPFRVYTRMLGTLADGSGDYGATEPIGFRPPSCRVRLATNMAQLLPEDPLGSMAWRARPRRIALTLDTGFVGLRWTSWGAPRAVAHGVALAEPYCESSTRRCPKRGPVRVTASRLGWCGSYLGYLRIDFPGVHAILGEHARTVDDECP